MKTIEWKRQLIDHHTIIPDGHIDNNGLPNKNLYKEHGLETLGGEGNYGIGWSSWRNRTGDLFVALFPLPGDVAPAGAF